MTIEHDFRRPQGTRTRTNDAISVAITRKRDHPGTRASIVSVAVRALHILSANVDSQLNHDVSRITDVTDKSSDFEKCN